MWNFGGALRNLPQIPERQQPLSKGACMKPTYTYLVAGKLQILPTPNRHRRTPAAVEHQRHRDVGGMGIASHNVGGAFTSQDDLLH